MKAKTSAKQASTREANQLQSRSGYVRRDPAQAAALARVRVPLVLGIMLLACYSFFFYTYANWNINTRLALTHAIVDRHTLAIDDYQQLKGAGTMDKAYFNGHYYCDKAVGASFLGVPAYWLFRELAGTSPHSIIADVRGVLGNHVISIATTALPSAIAGVLFFFLLGYITPLLAPRIWLTLAYGLGTIAFPYATMFFGHQTAAAFGFIAFFLLFRMRHKRWSHWGALGAGVLVGYSLITDFLSLVVALGLFCYAGVTLWQQREGSLVRRLLPLAPFCLGVLAPLPLQLWYNWACFGNPLASGYQYEVLSQFSKGMSQGLMGITWPKLDALFQLTFGPQRGIFHDSPWLLFTIPGAYLMLRRRKQPTSPKPAPVPDAPSTAGTDLFTRFRLEGWLSIGIVVLTLLLNSGYYLWWGGACYGARFAIVVLPFMALLAFFAIYRAPKAFMILAAFSILLNFVVVVNSPLIAESSPDPIYEGTLRDLFAKLHTATSLYNFNVMFYFNVIGLTSVIPLVGFIAGCLLYLKSLSWQRVTPHKS